MVVVHPDAEFLDDITGKLKEVSEQNLKVFYIFLYIALKSGVRFTTIFEIASQFNPFGSWNTTGVCSWLLHKRIFSVEFYFRKSFSLFLCLILCVFLVESILDSWKKAHTTQYSILSIFHGKYGQSNTTLFVYLVLAFHILKLNLAFLFFSFSEIAETFHHACLNSDMFLIIDMYTWFCISKCPIKCCNSKYCSLVLLF